MGKPLTSGIGWHMQKALCKVWGTAVDISRPTLHGVRPSSAWGAVMWGGPERGHCLTLPQPFLTVNHYTKAFNPRAVSGMVPRSCSCNMEAESVVPHEQIACFSDTLPSHSSNLRSQDPHTKCKGHWPLWISTLHSNQNIANPLGDLKFKTAKTDHFYLAGFLLSSKI